MALKIEVNLAGYPEGAQIGIVGVGIVENGGTIEIGEAEESAFFAQNGYTLHDVEQEGIAITGSPEFTPPEPVVEVVETTEIPTGLPTGLPQGDQGSEGGE